MRWYVYVYFTPWDGQPCYVGKGKGGRWVDPAFREKNSKRIFAGRYDNTLSHSDLVN
jgi:hypothetical protein